MPGMDALVNASFKYPKVDVFINGNRINNIISVEVNLSDTDLSTCDIELIGAAVDPNSTVLVRQGYDATAINTFKGFVDNVEIGEYPGSIRLSCRDVLKKAHDTFLVQEVKFGVDNAKGLYYYSTYDGVNKVFVVNEYGSLAALYAAHPETQQNDNITNQGAKAHAVVQWLMTMAGFAEGTEINVDDTNFFIGDINPAVFHLTSVYDAAKQIADLIGWRIYADQGGVVRFQRKPRTPSNPIFTFSTSSNTPNATSVRPVDTDSDLRNYVEVRGYNGIRIVLKADSPYIGNVPYRGVLISNELIDTSGIANYFANRVLSDLNRIKRTITVEGDAHPYIRPGYTVRVESQVANDRFLVQSYQTKVDAAGGYVGTMTAIAFPGDFTWEPDPDLNANIFADFSIVKVVRIGDPKFILTLDASASYSLNGPIVSYQWFFPDNGSILTADPVVTYAFDQAALGVAGSGTIALTVKDSLDASATVVKPITLSGLLDQAQWRVIYGAMTNHAVGSMDGGLTWRTLTIPAISVAASNFGPSGVYTRNSFALFGGSDGNIYKAVSGCASYSTVFTGTGANPVRYVFIPELDSRYAVAAVGKKLYSSKDSGETWTLTYTFTENISQALMGYTNFKEIDVLLDKTDGVFYSNNAGSTFSKVTIDRSSNFYRLDAGVRTHYYAAISPNGKGVFNDGSGIRQMSFSPALGAAGVEAITVAIDQDDGVFIADTTGQLWSSSGQTFYQTQNMASNLPHFMLRDGEVNNLIYYATQSGISKSLNRNATTEPYYTPNGFSYPGGTGKDTGFGKMVDYGPMLTQNIDIVIGGLIRAASGVGGGPWLYQRLTDWKQIIGNLPTTVYEDNDPAAFVVSTLNKNFLFTAWGNLLQANVDNDIVISGGEIELSGGYSPFWVSYDAGTTWEEIPIDLSLAMADHPTATRFRIDSGAQVNANGVVGFTATIGVPLGFGLYSEFGYFVSFRIDSSGKWIGGATRCPVPGAGLPYVCVPGRNSEWILSSTQGIQAYIKADESAAVTVGSLGTSNVVTFRIVPGTSKIAVGRLYQGGAIQDQIYRTKDYTTEVASSFYATTDTPPFYQPTPITTGIYSTNAGSATSNTYRMENPFATPLQISLFVTNPTGNSHDDWVAGAKRARVMVAKAKTSGVQNRWVIYDGVEFTSLDGPALLEANNKIFTIWGFGET